MTRQDGNRDRYLSQEEIVCSKSIFVELDMDKNGKLDAAELVNWRHKTPATIWMVRVGRQAQTSLDLQGSDLQKSTWVNDGKLPTAVISARQEIFRRYEGQGSSELDQPASNSDWLLSIADLDGDGNLTRRELDDWLELQLQISRGQILLTLLTGGGLFELLDTNLDGALSVRELRHAWKQLATTKCIQEGTVSQATIPTVVLAPFSNGYPDTFGFIQRPGPIWFESMDRNRDGDVTLSEFIYDREQFDALDRDQNGLLDVQEAKAWALQK